jgi:flavin reductase (DIM6/NTAB) family NADH-FMN oxidoreductase RutF
VVESIVGVVLVESGSRRNAITVSFFSEVAHHPTALWVGISPTSYTHSLIQEAGRFSLAVLNERQGAIAIHCGFNSGRHVDKCSKLDLYPSRGGYLFLSGALASTGCIVRESMTVGDHTLFIANIIEADIESRSSHLRQLLLSDLPT